MVSGQVEALVFDVFGTVVDWRGSVIQEGEKLGRAVQSEVDWPRFADAWRKEGYVDAIARIRRGEAPWASADELHRRKLDELLERFGIRGLAEDEIDRFNRVWHRLTPWPDALPGLTRLKARFVISPLSNGNFALLTNMAKRAGLPWDCIISAELTRKYKPEREVYLSAPALLGLQPAEVMMVAAHLNDLEGARAAGLGTAFVPRPLEHGPDGPRQAEPGPSIDVVAKDFVELAERLGA
ncbi:MAG: haloacid dehalogenase type II [Chloroflexi bacterium]|nr:haloacid dehalogenase type II [Chloroflexota bacterium]